MKFLIDVCAGQHLGFWLESEGHDGAFVRDRDPRMGDDEILEWGHQERRIIVTTDKDFGHLIFHEGKPHSGVVRLPNVPRIKRIALMKRVLQFHHHELDSRAIITVSVTRIRVRRGVE
ncbi:MAG: DUF5615 family PIN-like protein [bacterium]